MIDWKKPLRLKNGMKVLNAFPMRRLFSDDTNYMIIAENTTEEGKVYDFSLEVNSLGAYSFNSDYNVENVPEVTYKYQNIYRSKSPQMGVETGPVSSRPYRKLPGRGELLGQYQFKFVDEELVETLFADLGLKEGTTVA